MKELQDKAVELGQQVSNLCNEVAALQNMIGQYDYDLEQIDQEVMNQVLSATDNTGKPLYTNDTQRKTQHKLMLYNHEKYQSLRAQREDIKDQERQILWTLNGLKAQIKTLDIATR